MVPDGDQLENETSNKSENVAKVTLTKNDRDNTDGSEKLKMRNENVNDIIPQPYYQDLHSMTTSVSTSTPGVDVNGKVQNQESSTSTSQYELKNVPTRLDYTYEENTNNSFDEFESNSDGENPTKTESDNIIKHAHHILPVSKTIVHLSSTNTCRKNSKKTAEDDMARRKRIIGFHKYLPSPWDKSLRLPTVKVEEEDDTNTEDSDSSKLQIDCEEEQDKEKDLKDIERNVQSKNDKNVTSQKKKLAKKKNQTKHNEKVARTISKRNKLSQVKCATIRGQKSKVNANVTRRVTGKTMKGNTNNTNEGENDREVEKKGKIDHQKLKKSNETLQKETVQLKKKNTPTKQTSGRMLKDPTKTWLEQTEEEERSDDDPD